MADTSLIVHNYLLFFILPLWIAAGFADYLSHRATDISHTSGTREAAIHLLMVVEIGVPLLLALTFEINALILAILLGMLVVHELTGMWDLIYAHRSHREVLPIEQHVHSFLEIIPMMAVSFVVLLNWEQFMGLLGLQSQNADWELRVKTDYWQSWYGPVLLAVALTFSVLPFVEECWRCLRVGRRRQHADAAAQARAP